MTIKDIAKLSGYGISTVSRVLNNHDDVSEVARDRILKIVEENNFHLNNNAKHLKQKQANIVALIVKGAMNELFSQIIEKMVSKIKDEGCITTVRYIDEYADEVQYAKRLCTERTPIAICFLGGDLINFNKGFKGINIPCILITLGGSDLNFENLSSVTINDKEGGRFAITKLIQAGHQKIGIIGPLQDELGPANLRIRGFIEALHEYQIDINATIKCENSRYSYISGYQAMERLLEKMPDITAVCCMSDVMAIGAMRALSDNSKHIPEDVSIIGYDGIPVGQFAIPRLNTIKQDVNRLADESFEILKTAIEGNFERKHLVLPFEYLSGESIHVIK